MIFSCSWVHKAFDDEEEAFDDDEYPAGIPGIPISGPEEHEEVEGAFDDDDDDDEEEEEEEEEVPSCDVYETATGVCYHSAFF